MTAWVQRKLMSRISSANLAHAVRVECAIFLVAYVSSICHIRVVSTLNGKP